MTVEHGRSLHSTSSHLNRLNDRVWRLERDRCDCTKIPTKKPADIVIQPPPPPPPAAEGIIWGRNTRGDVNQLVRVKADWTVEPTGYTFPGVWFASTVNKGWVVLAHPTDNANRKLIRHLDGKFPDKTLVHNDQLDAPFGAVVWQVGEQSLAIGNTVVPFSSVAEVQYDPVSPAFVIPGGYGLYHPRGGAGEAVLYSAASGQVEEVARFTPPRGPRWHDSYFTSSTMYILVSTTTTGSDSYDIEVYQRSGQTFTARGSAQLVKAYAGNAAVFSNNVATMDEYGRFTRHQIDNQDVLDEIAQSQASGLRMHRIDAERYILEGRTHSFAMRLGTMEKKFEFGIGVDLFTNIV